MQFGNRFLFPLMVIAAVSVIAFGAVGIATLTGHLPLFGAKQAQFDKAQAPNVVAAVTPATDPELLVVTRSIAVANAQEDKRAKCKDCGIIESVEGSLRENAAVGGPLLLKAGDGSVPSTTSKSNGFLVRVRMDDGGLRVVQELEDPNLQLGQRVRIINGIIQPQS